MKKSILIVDDDKTLRESLARYLSNNFITHQASNGREALGILKGRDEIALVLSDLEMPDMDGVELLDNIVNERKGLKFIFVSSNCSAELIEYASVRGVYDFLPKPTDLDNLVKTINNALKVKSGSAKNSSSLES